MDFLIILIWILSILMGHILLSKVLEIKVMNKDLLEKFSKSKNSEYSKPVDELEKELMDYIEEQDVEVDDILKNKERQDIEKQMIPIETYSKKELEEKLKENLYKPKNKTKDSENLTLDAKYDIPSKTIIQKSQPGANTLKYQTLKPDHWVYKNEKPMNGGVIENGLTAYDPSSSYDFVAL